MSEHLEPAGFPSARGPTLGDRLAAQAREAQVDLAAGERLPRRVPRQRIDDDLGGGAPSSSWPIRFSQTPAVARRWPATGWRRSTGWYRPWLPRDTATGAWPPGRAALPSTSQDHINRSLHSFRGLPDHPLQRQEVLSAAVSRCGSAPWVTHSRPCRLSATICSHSCTGAPTAGPSSIIPALLTTVSNRPNSSTTLSARPNASARSVTSAGNISTRPPESRILLANSVSRSVRRAAIATAAPWPARATAMASPMPLLAPVIRAAVPSSLSVIGSYSVGEGVQLRKVRACQANLR